MFQWFVVFLAPVIIVLTLTRGNYVGLLMGLGIFMFLGRRLINSSRQIGISGLALIFVPLIFIGVQVLVPNELIEKRLGAAGNVYTRIATWNLLIERGLERPLVGFGVNNARGLLKEESTRFMGVASETTPHNSYLALLFETGAIGLLTYLALLGSIMRMALRLSRTGKDLRKRWRGVSVVAIMVAYLVPALFAITLYNPGLMHLYVYVYIGAIAGLYGKHGGVTDLSLVSRERLKMSREMQHAIRYEPTHWPCSAGERIMHSRTSIS